MYLHHFLLLRDLVVVDIVVVAAVSVEWLMFASLALVVDCIECFAVDIAADTAKWNGKKREQL